MAIPFPATIESTLVFPTTEPNRASYSQIYAEHCHRIYSLAFWMTDNELMAEELASNTFLRVFSAVATPTTEHVDRAFLAEVRELGPVGILTLQAFSPQPAAPIYGNIKRVYLERAVVELPATEKLVFLLHDVEGYNHAKIGRLLGLTEDESKLGLHQARLRIRELIAEQS
jgi:DNA-directed RNA polymerase specialized sigma24 family protein